MESIKDKVAIIGMGCIKFGENWEQTMDDMIVDAVYEAYEDAGVGPDDIQAGWWGNCWSGDRCFGCHRLGLCKAELYFS